MNDRKIIIILILLVIYIWGVKPLRNNMYLKNYELKNIEKEIQKEKFIMSRMDKIKKIYPKSLKVIKENLSLFYPYKVPVSIAMSNMQKYINSAALKNSVKIISTNWGSSENKKEYIVLPLSIVLNCNPQSLSGFIRDIETCKKLMKIRTISISHMGKNKLAVRAIITSFKLKKLEKNQ